MVVELSGDASPHKCIFTYPPNKVSAQLHNDDTTPPKQDKTYILRILRIGGVLGVVRCRAIRRHLKHVF